MGKQWLLYKVLAGDGTAGGCNNNGTTTSNTKSGGKSRKRRGGDRHVSSSSSSSGCMSAIFHLFDIQNHHFPFHQPPFISESTISTIHQQPNNIILKGVEAPRNSLELKEQEKTPRVIVEKEEEEVTSSSCSSSTRKLKQETNFDIPMMRDIDQIKTKRSRLMDMNNNDASSECSSSSPAGTKTPSLVARLMGLDLLPENASSPRPSLSSPRPSSSSSHHPTTPLNPLLSKLSSIKNNYNTRSLPVTPRASTTGRPSTEVVDYDHHHRLSLQGNKENKRRYDHESTTTSEYAKQIAKQVRENISRRVGADITNTSKNKKEHRRDEFLVVLKPKRPSPLSSANPFIQKISRNLDQENEAIPSSSSPRLKLLEIKKNNVNKSISNMPKSSPLSSSLSTEAIKAPSSLLPSPTSRSPPPTMMMKEEVQQVIKHHENINPMKGVVQNKCKKLIASEKYDLRLKKLHHQNEEPAKKCIIKKCNNNLKKSTPLSNQLVNNVNTTTKFISFKKDIIVSPSSTTTSPQKQVTYESITQLPSCQSRSYKNTKKANLSVQHDITTTNGNGATGASFSGHFDYISKILSHTGIEKTTPISITHWYSPSHPLHPSILENLNHPKTVTNRLIFDVVDELLVEILKPYISLKPWVSSATRHQTRSRGRMFGTQLVETLCDKISCFPEANCQVLEDIDGLIECDMKSNTKVIGEIAFEEEAEELVAELERDMVDTLVGEMAAAWITHATLDSNF
uniref:uncharacterized protein LOC122606087 isoform X2 n=1 Tax=Erigeron canadensis TaxID=72917 RepID=UPI001CB909E1|nr:uncharacterized protein LOC122606087 isoform X2 [Erigeron canadensis]